MTLQTWIIEPRDSLIVRDGKPFGANITHAVSLDFPFPSTTAGGVRTRAGLDAAGIRWERAPRLVRGLDYYRHTAFEFITDELGAQGTVLAGGRYDGLMEALGGPPTPAVGWAAGIERLAMLIDAPEPERPDAVLIPLGERAEAAAQRLLAELRRHGITADMAYRGNMKKRLNRADAAGARFALIVGDDELDRGEVQLKDLQSGEQTAIALERVAEAVRA